MAMLADPPYRDVTMDLKRPREGHVDVWVRCVVVLAIAATLGVLFAGPRVLWMRDGDTLGLPRFWFQNLLVIWFAATIVFACIPSARGSRFVRLAVLLPFVQVVVMLVSWFAWQVLKGRMPSAVDGTPLFDTLPVRIVLPWLALAIGLGARLVAGRRRREWLHAMVMLSLVNLLLLGVWLPIVSNQWNGHGWDSWSAINAALDNPAKMIAFVVVPPFIGALLFTATALRWPRVWRRSNEVVIALLVVVLITAIACRHDVSEVGAFVYVNFIHVIAAAAIVSVTSIVVLGLTLWIGKARARGLLDRGALVGTITSPNPVAFLELTSWLRGPRATCNAFTVTTPYGEVPVPAGAHVVTPSPLSTTLLLRNGEAVFLLRDGDRVALAGYEQVTTDGPFRQTSAPIPGAAGVTVGPADDERYGFAHVALDLWRPSIAYLLICIAVALPALAALLTKQF